MCQMIGTQSVMNRSILLIFLFAALTGCEHSVNDVSKSDYEQPNIVYILADDLGYGDIGPFGQKQILTPNLDRMSIEGMRLTQHYSGSPVCAPSRSVLMTGLHTGHTPIRGNLEHLPIGQAPLPYGVPTIAELLKKAGYSTGAFGKWGLGYPESEGSPTQQGFDYFFGYNDQRRAHFYYPEFLFREVKGKKIERVTLDGNEVNDNPDRHPGSGPPVKRGTYSQDAIAKEALSFIEDHANREAPFFLYMPMNIPHASLTVPRESMDPYLNENGDSIFLEKPFNGNHYTTQPKPRATYAAMVSLLDSYVGMVLDKLREEGIDKNTLVIFTSDNGPQFEGGHNPAFFDSNGPLRGGKRDLYEGGIRVPTIAWWPGTVPENTYSDHISAFEDMMPTFAQLAGIAPLPNIDGISMVPTLTGSEEQQKRNYLYWEFPAQGGKQAVRKGKWKAVRLDVTKNPDAAIELYNLNDDLGEQHNIAMEHPNIVDEMTELMNNARVHSDAFPLYE